MARTGSREAVFHPEFRDDLSFWVKSDRKAALRILELVEAAIRDPFAGIGKPEPLRYEMAGCKRRDFLQARYHYLGTSILSTDQAR